MEYTQEKLKADLKLLEQSVETLAEALRTPLTDIVRDAVIQRFEYVFELAWKTIQVAVQYMGSSCTSPREAVKMAFKMGWIETPDRWLEAMEARNKTSHTYNIELAKEVYEVAKEFPSLVNGLLSSLKKIVS